jgi:hypothetical protein
LNLNVNGFNSPIKRHRLSDLIKKQNPMKNIPHKERHTLNKSEMLEKDTRHAEIKTSMVLTQNRHEDQRNKTEDPNTNPHSYSHLIFAKVAYNMCWRYQIVQENWVSSCRRLKPSSQSFILQ